MGMFLPEGGQKTPGQASLTPASPNVTQEDVALMQRVLRAAAQNPNLIPDEFMAYALDYIQANNLIIPIGQVFGFAQFTAQTVPAILTQATTTSGTYGDLSDGAGPTLDGLPDGKYVVFFGAALGTSVAGHSANMSVSFNGATASDSDAIFSHTTDLVTCAGFTLATLSNVSNRIDAKYRSGVGGDTTTGAYRRLLALKYANL